MSSTYVIRWKSKVNGRAGKGTKQFERTEAERLAQELNREYPQIEHEPVKWTAQMSERSASAEEKGADALALAE
jgi:hypothetical protein